MLGTLHIPPVLHSIHARELHTWWLQNEEIESDVLGAMVKGRESLDSHTQARGGSISAWPSGT